MNPTLLAHKETLLIEILLSSLDVRTSAEAAEMPMLIYLADLLVKRTREELDRVGGKGNVEAATSETAGIG